MNERLAQLHAYPFERLARLKRGIVPPGSLPHIAMSIGEPKHAPPAFAIETLRSNLDQLGSYPATSGSSELRGACAAWLQRRFQLGVATIDPATMVLPVNGTREALFAFVQAIVPTNGATTPTVVMPNPFYQIYEGAALLAGAEPWYVNTTDTNNHIPDLDNVPEQVWDRCAVLFLCSPGNPSGAVMPLAYLRHALALAERYGFVIAADECYAELYRDDATPPSSLLNACLADGNDQFRRAVVFHSLSKRSSVPGLRSGFVAGDPDVLASFLLYRTYHGCAMPVPTQLASAAAWADDRHVALNRSLYREKFARVLPILAPVLPVVQPAGGFYLWTDVGADDEQFTRDLFATQNLTILPGSYLARDTATGNPGRGRVRISLVAPVEECVIAAERIRDYVAGRR
ncbi:MAG TPA: succinyldiaminopimelate transaminase [Steroidobacteraceae bacterium]|nr:succinyldiaminopimelate transaminase [Steroidobacteraceae bacterium]